MNSLRPAAPFTIALAGLLLAGCGRSSPETTAPGSSMTEAGAEQPLPQNPVRDLGLDSSELEHLQASVKELGGRVRRYQVDQGASSTSENTSAAPKAGFRDSYVEVKLNDTGVTDEDLASLATSPAIAEVTSLTIHNTNITNEGLRHLANAKNLEVIDLGRTPINDEGLEILKSLDLPNLVYVPLDGSRVSRRGEIDFLRYLEEKRRGR